MKKTAIVLAAGIAISFVLPGSGTAEAKDKVKDITCAQYLAMDPDMQDNVLYWLDGVATASSKKEVAAEDLEIGYDGWGDPVAALVTECRGDKGASLWSKIKSGAHKMDSDIKSKVHKMEKDIKAEAHKIEKKF